ncbi:uncharacterized protein [Eurosta solidaginis]|uniref:uncharacterized protein isoform X2 n=1 Tax=Eurosta solidaginis TaxID=178769 RepID=UPI0035313182
MRGTEDKSTKKQRAITNPTIMRLIHKTNKTYHMISLLVILSLLIISPAITNAHRHSRLDKNNEPAAVTNLFNPLQQQQQYEKSKLSDDRTSSISIKDTKATNDIAPKTQLNAVSKPSIFNTNLNSHKENDIVNAAATATNQFIDVINEAAANIRSATIKYVAPAEALKSGVLNASAENLSSHFDVKNNHKEVKLGEKESKIKINDDYSGVTSQTKNFEGCATELIGFEIITGYVFSAPERLSSSLPGTLMLTDCLDACRKDDSCHAVNYETGLCVLFSANADDLPGALAKSQFPVFTLYAQKSCLRKRPCTRAWYIDRVQGYKLNGYVRRKFLVESRQDCFESCLNETEFACRSANYYRQTRTCELSEMDRITLTGTSAFQQQNDAVDYLENNCIDEPNKLCEFKRLPGRILKTVDAVYQDVGSIVECRDLCLNSPYRCHSYDYGDTGDMVCRLSHHSRITLTDVQDPYLEVSEATTYELSSCYNVTIECSANDMIARIRTSKLFDGKVYAKGSPKSCAYDVKNSLDFELRMGYQNLECNIHQSITGRYTNDVIIQHHDAIVTSSDLGLAVKCHYDLANKSLSNQVLLDVKDDFGEPALSEEVIVDSPNVLMKITIRDGIDVMRTAEVGDPLALKFEILDAQSPYEIFIRELVAMDGADNADIILIDSRGCPTDQFIMGPIVKSPLSGKILLAHFDAFKFPTSELVQFRALVTPCMPTCAPVKCEQADIGGDGKSVISYGRRRRSLNGTETIQGTVENINHQHKLSLNQKRHLLLRSRRATTTNQPSQEDMLLMQSIEITDKFSFNKEQQQQQQQVKTIKNEASKKKALIGKDGVEQGHCVNAIGLILAITSFLLAQLAVMAVWSYLYQRRQQRSYFSENLASESAYSLENPSTKTESSLVTKVATTSRPKIYERTFEACHGRNF